MIRIENTLKSQLHHSKKEGSLKSKAMGVLAWTNWPALYKPIELLTRHRVREVTYSLIISITAPQSHLPIQKITFLYRQRFHFNSISSKLTLFLQQLSSNHDVCYGPSVSEWDNRIFLWYSNHCTTQRALVLSVRNGHDHLD